MKDYFVYIMSNKYDEVIYTGVTNDLARRAYQHRNKLVKGFSYKYNLTKLVYFEITSDIYCAIKRVKQIKGWLRSKKIQLIESMNPKWEDLISKFNLFGKNIKYEI